METEKKQKEVQKKEIKKCKAEKNELMFTGLNFEKGIRKKNIMGIY